MRRGAPWTPSQPSGRERNRIEWIFPAKQPRTNQPRTPEGARNLTKVRALGRERTPRPDEV